MAEESELQQVVTELHAKANDIFLLKDAPVAAQLDDIVTYSELFKKFEAFDGLEQVDPSELQALQAEHAQVLEQARSLEGQLTGDLRGLHQKGKAVLRYLDVLPKRISSRRPRKG